MDYSETIIYTRNNHTNAVTNINIVSQTPQQMHRNRLANYDYGIVNSQSPQIYYYSTERDGAMDNRKWLKKTKNP